SGLIADAQTDRFRRAAVTTRRLIDSRVAEIVTIVLACLTTAAAGAFTSDFDLPAWYRPKDAGLHFSPAGWWHALISAPILLTLIIGWLWRLLVWCRFLWIMARLDLRLIPSHPDGVGGLRFVSCCLRGYRLIAFGMGAIVAGACADRILNHGAA